MREIWKLHIKTHRSTSQTKRLRKKEKNYTACDWSNLDEIWVMNPQLIKPKSYLVLVDWVGPDSCWEEVDLEI